MRDGGRACRGEVNACHVHPLPCTPPEYYEIRSMSGRTHPTGMHSSLKLYSAISIVGAKGLVLI